MINDAFPAISVIMPIYNTEMYLRECLDSVLNQTFTDMEIICVNDGSTDNSLNILLDYMARDSRIHIMNVPNGGYGKAVNIGMDAAQGKYMAILEPDDYLPLNAYELLHHAASLHHLDIVKGLYTTFAGAPSQYKHDRPRNPIRSWEISRPTDHPEWFSRYKANLVFPWSGLYRLDFLKSNHLRFHESPGASYQDTGWFFITFAYAQRFMGIPDVIYHYRCDNPASSMSLSTMQTKPLDVFHQEYLYALHFLKNEKEKAAIMPFIFMEWMKNADTHCKLITDDRKELYMKQWQEILQFNDSFLHPIEEKVLQFLKKEITRQKRHLLFSLPKIRSKRSRKIERLHHFQQFLSETMNNIRP